MTYVMWPVHVGFVVDKVVMGRVLLRVLRFLPVSVIPPIIYTSVSQTFFKWGPLSLVRMFHGPPYSWDYQTH